MTTTTDFNPIEWWTAPRTKKSTLKLNKAYREQGMDAWLLYSLLEQFSGEQVAPGRFTVDLSHVLKVIPSEDVMAMASEKANG